VFMGCSLYTHRTVMVLHCTMPSPGAPPAQTGHGRGQREDGRGVETLLPKAETVGWHGSGSRMVAGVTSAQASMPLDTSTHSGVLASADRASAG